MSEGGLRDEEERVRWGIVANRCVIPSEDTEPQKDEVRSNGCTWARCVGGEEEGGRGWWESYWVLESLISTLLMPIGYAALSIVSLPTSPSLRPAPTSSHQRDAQLLTHLV